VCLFMSRPVATYETASTRKYYNGRTETLRSCTTESLEWARSMLDPLATVEKSFYSASHCVISVHVVLHVVSWHQTYATLPLLKPLPDIGPLYTL